MRCTLIVLVFGLIINASPGFNLYGRWYSYKDLGTYPVDALASTILSLPEDAQAANLDNTIWGPGTPIHRDGVHRQSWLAKHRSVSR